MKILMAFIIAVSLLPGFASVAEAKEKLMVYTSMKESLIGKLAAAFTAKNSDIDLDYQSAGAGKLMAKIAAERESGTIMADILWTSEVPDFYQMKEQGILEKYISPEIKNILNPFDDFDGSFTPARLGTLGVAYNTRVSKAVPAKWSDLELPAFKGTFGIANPALSGTSYMSVALLVKQFGWEYIEKLKANGAKMSKGSGQVVDDTSSGDLVASLAVDYIANDKIKKGATLALVYPPEMLVIPSPVCIFKGTKNLAAAQKFIDFLISKEGQTIIAAEGTIPVRADVASPEMFKLPSAEDAIARSIKIESYAELIKSKEETVKRFSDIMQKR